MKKLFLLSFVGLFLLSLVSSPGFSQSTDDILEKMIEAQGGKKNLENVNDSTLSGKMFLISQNVNGPITVNWKKPNKARVIIELMGMKIVQATDGKIAWMDNPMAGGLQDMPEARAKGFKRNSLGDGIVLNPKKYGITYKFKGKEKVKDKDCLVMERAFSDGDTTTLYVDASTYLIYKSKSTATSPMGGMVDRETFYSDYKKSEGTMVAFALHTFIDGQEYSKLAFDKLVYNTGLGDSIFEKPKPKKEEPKKEEKPKEKKAPK